MNARPESRPHASLRPHRARQSAAVAIVLILGAASHGLAHEGHAPLPSKGVLVDAEKGMVILSGQAQRALGVQTAEVDLRPLEERVLAYATLETPWTQHAYVTTPIGGRIASLYVRPGDSVEAGQVLAEVRSLELENIQLELLRAHNEVQLSEKQLEQMERLARTLVPGSELQELRTKHRQNRNALEISRSKLATLGLLDADLDAVLQGGEGRLIGSLPLVSPIAGTILHMDLQVGKVVGPQEHLLEIGDHSRVWVRIDVLERDLYRVEVGQPVALSFAAYPSEVVHSTIKVKGRSLDEQTHLGRVWTELENPSGQEPRFVPGLQGQARITVSPPGDRLAVPAAALITDGAENYVLVEEAATSRAHEYRRQNVVVELRTREFAYLRDGNVFPGDRVVTAGSHELATSFIQGVLRPSPEAARGMDLEVAPAERHVVQDVLALDGVIELPPERRAFASSQLPGTLKRIIVDRGQAVRAGEVIAEVASLELQELQLDLLGSHLEIELLEQTLGQLRSVGDSGLIVRQQLWELESRYNAALNRRETAERKLAAAGLSDEQIQGVLSRKRLLPVLPIRAPIDGVVVGFDKVLGQVIPAEDPLFEIHDLSHVWVRGYLSERDLPAVRIGQHARVRLTADPSFVGRGKVVRSGQMLGAEDRTLSMWVEFDEQPGSLLQQGMLTRLTLTNGTSAAGLAVPRGAILREGTRIYVFVEQPNGIFERRPVTIGRADDRYVQITGGLRAGERIAVQGTARLQTAYAAVR